jgi:hypothetical protein
MAAQLTPEQIEKWREKAMKLQPTPNGSVYMKPQDMDWAPSQFPGIQIKVLYKNEAEGEIEQTYVLEGSFSDHDGIARAGEYVWRHSGSMHETYSEEGCTILAIYRRPNIFAKSAGFSTPKT